MNMKISGVVKNELNVSKMIKSIFSSDKEWEFKT